jgi:hypothetical protein
MIANILKEMMYLIIGINVFVISYLLILLSLLYMDGEIIEILIKIISVIGMKENGGRCG